MVKSTPIAQVMPQQQPKTISQDGNEDINIEDLVREKEGLSIAQQQQQQQQQNELQNQIDLLKREIEMNKSQVSESMPIHQHILQQSQHQQPQMQQPSQSITDSIINKNAILSFMNDFDYYLFVILVFVLMIMYSESVRSFISEKLELKNLAYLTSYTQAFVSAMLVVLIKKLN